jgi:hypothetical protein
MRPTTKAERAECLRYLNEGQSYRYIRSKIGLSLGNISTIAISAGLDLSSRNGGRPRVLSDKDKRSIVRAITSGRCDNAKQVKRMLQLPCSFQTVRNGLRKEGLIARVKLAKPALNVVNRHKRLEFCKRYQYNTSEDWQRVLFSDETKINRLGSDGRDYVWGKKGSRRTEREIKRTVKGAGGSIMVWGCFSLKGVGRLAKVEGTMDKKQYCKILDNNLFTSTRALGYRGRDFIFQHDNDPKHTAFYTADWFKDHKVDVLYWPPQSPDLNPIEHLWAIIKRKLNDYPTQPSSMHNLEGRIREVWNNISVEECKKLIDSMPDRIAAVIKAKGDWTDY